MGFVSPITISGKILLREAVPAGSDWDEPLSEDYINKWKTWLENLQSVENVKIPRVIVPTSISLAHNMSVHIFSDPSEQAVAAYLNVEDQLGNPSIEFLMGKSKRSPLKGHTIPRLELCASVLATDVGEILSTEMNIPPDILHYYTDSKVVLGYISNTTRRLFTYVSNRVEKILSISSSAQWSYVRTDLNPADMSTRYVNS